MLKEFTFDGIEFIAPEEVAKKFSANKYTYKSFPAHYCGAGKGFGEIVVPDYIFGPTRYLKFLGLDISIKISPACFIHDCDWDVALPTWDAFKESNERLLRNIEAIVESKSRNEWIQARAMYRPATYFNAVNIAGRGVFWTLKWKQFKSVPEDAMHFVHK